MRFSQASLIVFIATSAAAPFAQPDGYTLAQREAKFGLGRLSSGLSIIGSLGMGLEGVFSGSPPSESEQEPSSQPLTTHSSSESDDDNSDSQGASSESEGESDSGSGSPLTGTQDSATKVVASTPVASDILISSMNPTESSNFSISSTDVPNSTSSSSADLIETPMSATVTSTPASSTVSTAASSRTSTESGSNLGSLPPQAVVPLQPQVVHPAVTLGSQSTPMPTFPGPVPGTALTPTPTPTPIHG